MMSPDERIAEVIEKKGKRKMTVGEMRNLCGECYVRLIGARTGKKLANNWQNSKETLGKYDNCFTSGIFPSMRINTNTVKMPSCSIPIICIWVEDK